MILSAILATFALSNLITPIIIILVVLAIAFFINKFAPIEAKYKEMLSYVVYAIIFFVVLFFILDFFGLWHLHS